MTSNPPRPLHFDLSGRRVLVIGASSGLGLEVARVAHAAGATVALAARRIERLEAECDRLGQRAIPVACDVRNQAACGEGVGRAIEALGGLDAMVYAAGLSPLGMIRDADQEQWSTVLETNVVGASFSIAGCIDALRDSGGRVLLLSSYSVRSALPGTGLYSTSKVALDGLLAAWRMEHPDLRFTRVVVGNTAGTEFAHAWDAKAREEIAKLWVERGVFTSATIMPIDECAEAIVAALASRAYVDDIAIMPDPGQPSITEYLDEEFG